MTAFGKLIRTTAFRLTLAYLLLFALFAASLLGYFAWNTRRLITEQIATTVNAESSEMNEIFARRGLRGLVFTIENRALRPGANLYLVTTPTGQAVAGNVGSLAPGVMATSGWSETAYRRLDEQETADHRALARVTELPGVASECPDLARQRSPFWITAGLGDLRQKALGRVGEQSNDTGRHSPECGVVVAAPVSQD